MTRILIPGLILIVAAELVFSGFRFSDADRAAIFEAGRFGGVPALPADRQYILEDLLPNAIGWLMAQTGLAEGKTLLAVWWFAGLGLLAGAAGLLLKARRLSVAALVLLLAYTRVTDTLFLWVGKTDPYYLAFFLLAVFCESRALAALALSAAAFCHPEAAVVATAGLVLLKWAETGRFDRVALAASICAAVLSIGLTWLLYPGEVLRPSYVLHHLSGLFLDGLRFGLLALMGGLVLPLAAFMLLTRSRLRSLRTKPGILICAWFALVAFLSGFVTADQTRVMTLLCLPVFAYAVQRYRAPLAAALAAQPWLAVVLFVARLASPHVGDGGWRLGWHAWSWHGG